MSSCSSPDISFEHFDPQFELGNLDTNGKPIRPRKKPGRKPNPPSPTQRKAQNRAAQRTFRERKRREMKEAETTVKQCLSIRDQALSESRRLRNKVEELGYENKYLKGQLLILKIACFANRVDVPKLWDICNQDAADKYDFIAQSRTKGVPQSMEIFLDKNRNIINLIQHKKSSASANLSSLSPELNPQPPNSDVCSPTSAMTNLHQYETNNDDCFITRSTYLSPPPTCNTDSSLVALSLEKLRGMSSISELLEPAIINNPITQLDPNHWLQQQDLHPNHLAAVVQAMTKDNTQLETTDQDALMEYDDTLTNIKQEDTGITMDIKTEPNVDPKTGLNRVKTIIEDDHTTVTLLTLSASQLQSAPPMKPLEALEFIRTVKKADHNTRSLLQPTELQKSIAHDSRIDYVPGPMIRDLMIIYQDFYNANELFALLVESSNFLGGDLRNPDCWSVSPSFFLKYWFVCPNHRPQRLDNFVDTAVGLGQDMIKMMMERKAMYFERERFADHFPSDSDTALNQQNQSSHYQQEQHEYQQERKLQEKQQQQQQQYEHEQLYGRDKVTFDAFSGYDFSLNAPLMSFMDDTDLFISL